MAQAKKKLMRPSLILAALAMLVGLIGQHLWNDWRHAGATMSLVLFIGLGVGSLAAFIAWWARDPKWARRLLASPPMVTVLLGAITLATVAGTMVLQRVAPDRFDQLYGGSAGILRFLFMEDLFHAFWFDAWVVLMTVSLSVSALRFWPWTWKKSGLVAAHMGIVIALAGALVGAAGSKGRLDLEVGVPSARVLGHDWRTGRRIPMELPFQVRLDDFHIETHDEAYRIYVFEKKGEGMGHDAHEILLAVDPTEQQGKTVALKDGHALRIDRYDPGAQPGPPRAAASHHLLIEGQRHEVKPGETYAQLSGHHVTVGQHFPHFNYDIKNKRPSNASDHPENPALHVMVRRGGPEGEVRYEGWLFANMPGTSMSKTHGDGEGDGWVPTYVFSGAQETGEASVQVTPIEAGRPGETVRLALSRGQQFVHIAGGRFVGVFRVRKDEAKNYYSELSILEQGKVVEKEMVFVNEPMSYGGYTLYQSNYDPRNLAYSGIEVVRDPGLWLVYLGMTLMMLGVFQVFYFRKAGSKKEASR
jgi:hypothetical protein